MEKDPELRELFGEREAQEYERLAEQTHPDLEDMARERLERDRDHYQVEVSQTEKNRRLWDGKRLLIYGSLACVNAYFWVADHHPLNLAAATYAAYAGIRTQIEVREKTSSTYRIAKLRTEKLNGLLGIIDQRNKSTDT